MNTLQTFDNAGLVPHPQKSTFVPVQEIVLLGFVINSLSTTIRLTVKKKEKKKEKIKSLVTQVMISRHVQIHLVAKLIGCLVASLPAVMHGALYYKYLEKIAVFSI